MFDGKSNYFKFEINIILLHSWYYQTIGDKMQWEHVLTIIGGNAAMFLPMFFWLRSEANSDRRDIMNILVEMKDEMKEFHGRLCSIEERNRK